MGLNPQGKVLYKLEVRASSVALSCDVIHTPSDSLATSILQNLKTVCPIFHQVKFPIRGERTLDFVNIKVVAANASVLMLTLKTVWCLSVLLDCPQCNIHP